MTTDPTIQSTPARPGTNSLASALLWCSAFVLIGLIIVQAGRAASSPHAADAALAEMSYSDVVSRVGDHTVMTFNAGSDDVLAVLDGRGEAMYYYRVLNMRTFEFLGRDDLKTMFTTAKRIGPGRR